jgi:hypothetical protein
MKYLFKLKEQNIVVSRKMDGTGDHFEQNKPSSKSQTSHVFILM